MNIVNANDGCKLWLGRQSEDNRTQVVFDISDIFEEFPDGVAVIISRRPDDESAHIVDGFVQDGGTVRWTVSDYELAKDGIGEIQLIYSVTGVVAKTKTWKTIISKSLTAVEGTPPEWVDVFNQLIEAAGSLSEIIAAYDAMTATAVTLAPDQSATAEIDHSGDHPVLTIGVPQGQKGETGNGISSVVFNANYTATIHFTDGTQTTIGPLRGATGNGIDHAEFNADDTLTFYYDDGNSFTTPSLRGEKGDTGNGITAVKLNTDYTLTIEFDDGASFTTSSIRGERGKGIFSTVLNSDYTLTVIYTDGTSTTVGPIRGETGNGIDHVKLNSDYTMTIFFTDGNSETIGPVRGEKGEKGDKGDSYILTQEDRETIAQIAEENFTDAVVALRDETENFKNQAEDAANRAEQAASEAGYMEMEIVNGHLIYRRTSNVGVDFKLTNGHLIMEVV